MIWLICKSSTINLYFNLCQNLYGLKCRVYTWFLEATEKANIIETTVKKPNYGCNNDAGRGETDIRENIHTTLSKDAMKVLERYEKMLGAKNAVMERALELMEGGIPKKNYIAIYLDFISKNSRIP